MLELLDLEKVARLGPKRFMVFFALALSMLFFGLFIAIGVAIDGRYVAGRELLATSFGYGVVMSALFGRRIWRLESK
jgi:hypothetical protein